MPSSFAGRYEIIRRLGTGGMAEVFLARQTGAADFEKIVAIKSILPHLVEIRSNVEMFIDEARIAAQLNHAGIVQIFDFGIEAGAPFLVMEFVHGVTLRALLQKCVQDGRPLPLALALYIMRSVVQALDYAHRKCGSDGRPLNIIHRDLDPQNILLSFDGEAKIGDFGIARADIQIHQTATGTIKGKMHYTAPEAFAAGPLDQRADLYSLGVVFYEMLAGARPFEDKEPLRIPDRILSGDCIGLRSKNPDVPADLAAIVHKAFAVLPSERYASARDLLAALERFIESQPQKADARKLAEFLEKRFPGQAEQPIAPLGVAEPPQALEGGFGGLSRTERVPKPMEKKLILGGLSLIVVLIAFLAIASFRSRPSQKTEEPPLSPEQTATQTPGTQPAAPAADESIPVPVAETPSIKTKPQDAGNVAVEKPAPAATESIKAFGFLSLGSDVGCDVSLDGKPVGATPVSSVKVSAGKHNVLFKNKNLGLSRTLPVTVEPGKTKNLSATFLAVLMVSAEPWAEVFLDGAKIGDTPLVRKDIKPGSHAVKLVNAKLGKEKTVTRNFQSGATVKISENLKE